MVVQMVNNINLGNLSFSGRRKDGKGMEEKERVEADENLNKEETEPDLPVGKSLISKYIRIPGDKRKLVASGKETTSDKSEESWRHSWSCCR